MAIVRIDPRRDIPAGSEGTAGFLRAKASRIREDGAEVVFPDVLVFTLPAGETTECEIPDNGPDWFWSLELGRPVGEWDAVLVRDVTLSGSVDWADVVVINPETHEPLPPEDLPTAAEVLAEAGQARTDAVDAAAEAEAARVAAAAAAGASAAAAASAVGAGAAASTAATAAATAAVAPVVATLETGRLSPASLARFTTAPGARAEGKASRGMIALIFDDNWIDQYTFGAPALEARGFKATFVVNPVTFGGTDRMTAANVAELAARGHEIGNHTQSHVDMTTQTAAERAAAWDDAQAAINSLVGKPATTFAYPFNKTNLEIDQQCYLRFDRAFTGNAIPFLEPLTDRDTFLHGRWSWSNDTSSIHTRALNWVRLAATTDIVFTLFAHHLLDATTAADGNLLKTQFIELLDLAVTLGVPIVPANVAFPKFDKLPDAGHESTNTLYHRVSGTNATNTYTSVVLTPPPLNMAGARCKRFTGDGTATLVDMQDVYIPVRSSEPWTLSARFRQTRASGSGSRLVIKEYDSYGTQIGADITSALLNTTFDWQQVTLDYTPSATARSFTPGWRQELMSGTTDVDHMCIDMKRRPALG